ADLLTHVDVTVGVAQHGQIARHAGEGLGDDVEVLRGVQRHVHARHAADVASPQPGAVHDDVARDVAVVRGDTRGGAAVAVDAGHGHVLDDGGAALPRALREGQRGVDRVRAPVARNPHGPGQIVRAHERPEASGLARRDDLDLDAETLRHRGAALELDQALAGPRDADAAGTPEPRGLSGLRLELLVEHGAVAREAREVVAGSKLADESRRVPGGAARELSALEQQDVAPPEPRQVIRDATADDASADDDGARVRWDRSGHRRTIAQPRGR